MRSSIDGGFGGGSPIGIGRRRGIGGGGGGNFFSAFPAGDAAAFAALAFPPFAPVATAALLALPATAFDDGAGGGVDADFFDDGTEGGAGGAFALSFPFDGAASGIFAFETGAGGAAFARALLVALTDFTDFATDTLLAFDAPTAGFAAGFAALDATVFAAGVTLPGAFVFAGSLLVAFAFATPDDFGADDDAVPFTELLVRVCA